MFMVLNVAVKKQHVHRMSVAEMRMLRWISENVRKNKIRVGEIHLNIKVNPTNDKMRESHLSFLVMCRGG